LAAPSLPSSSGGTRAKMFSPPQSGQGSPLLTPRPSSTTLSVCIPPPEDSLMRWSTGSDLPSPASAGLLPVTPPTTPTPQSTTRCASCLLPLYSRLPWGLQAYLQRRSLQIHRPHYCSTCLLAIPTSPGSTSITRPPSPPLSPLMEIIPLRVLQSGVQRLTHSDGQSSALSTHEAWCKSLTSTTTLALPNRFDMGGSRM